MHKITRSLLSSMILLILLISLLGCTDEDWENIGGTLEAIITQTAEAAPLSTNPPGNSNNSPGSACSETPGTNYFELNINSGFQQENVQLPCWLTFNVPDNYEMFTLELQVSAGEFDLYLVQDQDFNQQSFITSMHLLNFSEPISANSRAKYAVTNNYIKYRLAILPKNAPGSYVLNVKSGIEVAQAGVSQTTSCSGGICSSQYPLSGSSNEGVFIGSEFGDRVIFPIDVMCAGKITANATWTGSAHTLALILNGPGQIGYFDRVDGPSPLSIEYNVESTNLQQGTRWFITLTNFSGGTATGSVEITYPSGC